MRKNDVRLENNYQVQSVKNVILEKERHGIDATYERELLEAWSHRRGFKTAKQALKECDEAVYE